MRKIKTSRISRFLALFLSVAMMAGGLSVPAYAEPESPAAEISETVSQETMAGETIDETAETSETQSVTDCDASIGDATYSSLSDAFAAAQDGDTICLLRDVTLNASIPVRHSVTLQAPAGETHTITRGSSLNYAFFKVLDNASFTIGDADCSGGTVILDGDGANHESLGVLVNPSGGTFTLHCNGILQNNRNRDNGGAIYAEGGTTHIYGTIRDCTAANGGAIYATSSACTIHTYAEAIFTGNRATSNGGAIYTGNLANVATFGGTFSGNEAAGSGGAVWFGGPAFTSPDLSVKNNTAGTAGGGVYMASTGSSASQRVFFRSGVITENTAPQGNDVYVHTTACRVSGSATIGDLFISQNAGVLYCNGSMSGSIGLTYYDASRMSEESIPLIYGVSGTYDLKEQDMNCFFLNQEGYELLYSDGTIYGAYAVDISGYPWLKSTADYDAEILSAVGNHYSDITATSELSMLAYRRDFISKLGYSYLKQEVTKADKEALLTWLMNDEKALRYYTTASSPYGTYPKSLQVLSDLYAAYGEDLKDAENGDLYLRMMISLSMTHSAPVLAWYCDKPITNAVTRYKVFKDLYDANLLSASFDNLTIEEMNMVMDCALADDEIIWLNYFVRDRFLHSMDVKPTPQSLPGGYQFIQYDFEYNYRAAQYYDAANEEQYRSDMELDNSHASSDYGTFPLEFNVEYGGTYPRLWIVFIEYGVCGAISKSGSNQLEVFGIPATVIGQPGHAAYLWYRHPENDSSRGGSFSIYNDISGWPESEVGGTIMCDWGLNTNKGGWSSYYNVSYVNLAMDNLNETKAYHNSIALCNLAKAYSNAADQEAIYQAAIDAQPKNLTAWVGLLDSYKAQDKSDSDYLALAADFADAMMCYPLPLHDFLNNLLRECITSTITLADLTELEHSTLTRAKNASYSDGTANPSACRTMAENLLGNTDYSVVTFSFDGDNAGCLKLAARYSDGTVPVTYSLDGGETWSDYQEATIIPLSQEELASITAENDIQVKLVGSSTVHTIDITMGAAPNGFYRNDNENRLVNASGNVEYSTDSGETWAPLDSSTIFGSHDHTILVRRLATGTCMTSAEATYRFYEDISTPARQYIPVSHLTVADVSTEASDHNGHAKYAIDGNANTLWHTTWDGTDEELYITIELDEARWISGFDYTPRQSEQNGDIQAFDLYISENGTDWTLAASVSGWAANNSKKSLTLRNPVYGSFVKIDVTTGYGNFASAAMLEFFEDTTCSGSGMLSALVEEYEPALECTYYTEETFAAFRTAMEEAKELLTSNASESLMAAAAEKLRTAYDALTYMEGHDPRTTYEKVQPFDADGTLTLEDGQYLIVYNNTSYSSNTHWYAMGAPVNRGGADGFDTILLSSDDSYATVTFEGSSDQLIWNLSRNADNTYSISNGDGSYLKLSANNNAALADAAQNLTISAGTAADTVAIKNGNCYLDFFCSVPIFSGWTKSSPAENNSFYLYRVVPAQITHTVVTTQGQEATCTEDGLTEGSHCSACGEVIEAQEIIPATSHSFTTYVSNNDGTCVHPGTMTATCDHCDATDTKEDPNANIRHSIAMDAEVPATCTEDGLTEGSHCDLCGMVLVEQEVIPATGHDWDEGVQTGSTITYTCRHCGQTYMETVASAFTAPTVSLTVSRSSTLFFFNRKITMSATTTNPDGVAILSSGFVYIKTSSLGSNELTVNTSGASVVTCDSTFDAELSPSNQSTKYTIRAFVTYYDENGQVAYAYSDAVSKSYKDIK